MCTSKNELNLGNSPIVNAEDLPLVLTVAEVAKILGVGKNTAAWGRIPPMTLSAAGPSRVFGWGVKSASQSPRF